jgi:tRNA threonylcarbamoyladenosine biosynthesis protein TsaB
MAFILNLETSTTVCSVSVSAKGDILSFREQRDAKSHASQLIPFVDEALRESGLKPQDLSAVAVSKGPGSYTGLRIGVSTAKGLAYALQLPLIAVDTLYSMASGFMKKYPEFVKIPDTLFCPMIDARRMEVYSSLYNSNLREIRNIKAEIITPESFLPELEKFNIHFFGDGAMKCKDTINHKAASFHEDFHPSSTFMAEISYEHFMKSQFVNLAYFEPFYLKDFVATIPGNKLLQ